MQAEMSAQRMAELERRICALEERTRGALWREEKQRAAREDQLVERHGECVGKTAAARILGVTRATVYAMLEDGRIAPACAGRKVDVRSIARYLMQRTNSSPKGGNTEENCHECA